MLRIALIGAGQLGSRHLQALAQFDRPAQVTVLDPFPASLATAEERFRQVAQDRVRARFVSRFEDLPDRLDAAVVATGADTRRAAIEQLLGRADVGLLLLEKVLFQRAADYAAVGGLLERKGAKAWVNCAQRLWPFFRDLRPRTLGASNVQLLASGANWGLGCNAIHNLDALAFLTGDADCRIEAALDPGTIASKRPGFVEFTGTLYGHGPRGNRVVQTSWRDGDAPFEFELQGRDFRALWRVGDANLRIAEAASGWQWREQPVSLPYQSQLTHGVLAQMIDQGTSVLPTYAESSALHLAMLERFLAHGGAAPDAACPIT